MKILILCLIVAINGQSSEIYTCTRDVNIAASLQQSALIASFKTIDRILCLGECNRNPSCLSCSYNNDATTTTSDRNCYLYNRVFNSSEYSYAINVNWHSKKGSIQSSASTITTTTTKTITSTTATTKTSTTTTGTASTVTTTSTTTTSSINQSGCNSNLLCYFRNTTLNSSITNYNSQPFSELFSTEMAIVNNIPVYFLADNLYDALIKMSDSWQHITDVVFNSPRVIKWANDQLYVSSFHGFHKMDYNFNINKSIVDIGALYTGIYHNASDNTLAVTVLSRKRVDWIDADLNVLANISTGSYSPIGIAAYGGSFYVSATSGSSSTVILVIRNRVINNALTISNTNGKFIYSIIIDDYGYMALSFRDESTVQLYHMNGTLTGFNLIFPYWVNHVNFDFNGRMMISTSSALYFYN